jgi:hypothetical protein
MDGDGIGVVEAVLRQLLGGQDFVAPIVEADRQRAVPDPQHGCVVAGDEAAVA